MQSSLRWMLAFGLGVASVAGMAEGVVAAPSMRALQDQVESSMRIKGSLDIGADGRVVAVRLDQQDAIPAGVVGFVKESMAGWEFEPTLQEGKTVPITTPVSLRVVGKVQGDGSARIEIRSASFVDYREDDLTRPARLSGSVPTYPVRTAGRGVAADVFLLIQVGRDGKVRNVAAEQVNLRVLVPPRQLDTVRTAFANSAIQAVRDWQFRIPTQGPLADRETWVVRLPVRYADQPPSGDVPAWEPYLPGPRQRAAWQQPERVTVAPDALGDGVYVAGDTRGPVLKTVLGQS